MRLFLAFVHGFSYVLQYLQSCPCVLYVCVRRVVLMFWLLDTAMAIVMDGVGNDDVDGSDHVDGGDQAHDVD